MSAVVYFAHGARVRAIGVRFLGVVLLSVLDSKRLSQTDVWHHFWHRDGFLGTVFGTGNRFDSKSITEVVVCFG